MTKDKLRIYYKDQRQQITESQEAESNKEILRLLKEYSWAGIKYLHSFLPIEKMKEPDIWPFITWMQRYKPEVCLLVSRSNRSDYSMRHFVYTEKSTLRKNKWGILEPVEGKEVLEDVVDAVLVPLLVADKNGNRVGYGKGFYDRFLAQCRPDCQKIGVSFFDPVEPISDIGPFDIPLDMLVTPSGVWTFK